MQKTILITGSTDGIGLATAKMLAEKNHHILLHGRSQNKLEQAVRSVAEIGGQGNIESYIADLSDLDQVEALATSITDKHSTFDVLINNAGIFRTSQPITAKGLDVRFVVNTLAPYLLTKRLIPLLGPAGRVVNLSSAAQSPVNLKALNGEVKLRDEFDAYAQSKLAITMWSRNLAMSLGKNGPAIIAVNPGSMLGSKMVREGFGVAGGDIGIGAEILVRAALSDEFENLSGEYYDNDTKQVASPHRDSLDTDKSNQLIDMIEQTLSL